MNKLIQKIIYSVGVNISAYDVEAEIRLLQKKLPPHFRKREVVDIGCGDGKVSLELKKVLKPVSIKGVDVSSSLISTAKDRGLEAEIMDVSKEKIEGDLGILWGVIHHFDAPVQTLHKIYRSFNSLIIRAPVDERRICELGYKYNKQEFLSLLAQTGIDIKKQKLVEAKKNNSLILFIDH